jgi:hypothetical protein
VPSSWELVRRGRNGDTDVIARNVLSFDLASDGSALYSDGVGISRVGREGRSERLLQAELIEKVLAL